MDTQSWQYLLFSGIPPHGVTYALCGHSQLAILTVQWNTSKGVGTVWTLTAGNTYCSVGYIPRGYRRYCVDTHGWQYLLFSGVHSHGGIVGTVWTLTAGNTYCSVGYIPRGYRRYCVDTHSWQYLLFSGIHP